MTTAEALARLATPAELEAGRLRTVASPAWSSRTAAARIARLLAPAAAALGGWTSTEVVVRFRRDPDTAARPDVALCVGDPPVSGVVDTAPLLVALIGAAPAAARRWLEHGTAAVWLVDVDRTTCVTVAAVELVPPDGELSVPGAGSLSFAPADLTAGLGNGRTSSVSR